MRNTADVTGGKPIVIRSQVLVLSFSRLLRQSKVAFCDKVVNLFIYGVVSIPAQYKHEHVCLYRIWVFSIYNEYELKKKEYKCVYLSVV
jgi:hypothetical protein